MADHGNADSYSMTAELTKNRMHNVIQENRQVFIFGRRFALTQCFIISYFSSFYISVDNMLEKVMRGQCIGWLHELYTTVL